MIRWSGIPNFWQFISKEFLPGVRQLTCWIAANFGKLIARKHACGEGLQREVLLGFALHFCDREAASPAVDYLRYWAR
jgi:hypothetical protein